MNGMADPADGIVERYAEHLARKAGSAVVTLAVAGAVAGAVLGAIPGLLSHSVISPGTNYFAVLLGAIAGGFAGRSLGEKRAVGLRLQAQMALHQAQLERRIPAVATPPVPAAPVAPVLPPAQQVPPLVSPAPVAPVVVAAPPVPPPPAPPAASAPAPMPPATVPVVPVLRAAAPPVAVPVSEQPPPEQGPKLPPLTAPASSDR
jgi:hypothetical protein